MELFFITSLLVLILSVSGGILITALVSSRINRSCQSCNCVKSLDQQNDKCDLPLELSPYPRAPLR